MPASRAEIATPNGSRYLQQLCKHWSHKFAVEFGPERGRIDLGEGRLCRMEAADGTLRVEAEAADPEALTRLEGVIAEHLKRFAFREDLAFDWRPA